jgi:hypothetical protein
MYPFTLFRLQGIQHITDKNMANEKSNSRRVILVIRLRFKKDN